MSSVANLAVTLFAEVEDFPDTKLKKFQLRLGATGDLESIGNPLHALANQIPDDAEFGKVLKSMLKLGETPSLNGGVNVRFVSRVFCADSTTCHALVAELRLAELRFHHSYTNVLKLLPTRIYQGVYHIVVVKFL